MPLLVSAGFAFGASSGRTSAKRSRSDVMTTVFVREMRCPNFVILLSNRKVSIASRSSMDVHSSWQSSANSMLEIKMVFLYAFGILPLTVDTAVWFLKVSFTPSSFRRTLSALLHDE